MMLANDRSPPRADDFHSGGQVGLGESSSFPNTGCARRGDLVTWLAAKDEDEPHRIRIVSNTPYLVKRLLCWTMTSPRSAYTSR